MRECAECHNMVQNTYLRQGKWVCWDCALKHKLGQFRDAPIIREVEDE